MTRIYCDLQNSCEFNSLLSINILFWGEILSFGKKNQQNILCGIFLVLKRLFFLIKKVTMFPHIVESSN